MYHDMHYSRIEDLHQLVLKSKSKDEQNYNIRNFFEMCEDSTKKELLNLLKIEKGIEEVTVDEIIHLYRLYVLPSYVCEHSYF